MNVPYQKNYMIQGSGQNNLFIFEGAVDNFTNYLLDIAIAENKINNKRAIILTSHISDELRSLVLRYPFMELSSIETPNEFKVFYKNKLDIIKSIKRIFLSQFYFKKKAIQAIKVHTPKVIYIQKGNYGEVPYLVEIAKKNKITTVALQSSYCSFGLYSLLDNFIYRNKSKNIYHYYLIKFSYKIIDFYNILIKYIQGVKNFEERNNRGGVDLYFVDNKKFALYYSIYGQNPESIENVGVPEDDILYRRYLTSTQEDTIGLILSNGPAVWLNCGKYKYIDNLRFLINFLKISGIRFRVKLHPSDSIFNYQNIDNFTNYVETIDTFQLISECKLIITNGGSTTRYPGLIGKQCIVYPLDNYIGKKSADFFEVPYISNPKVIVELFKTINNKNKNIFIDGNATYRIINKVYEKIKL